MLSQLIVNALVAGSIYALLGLSMSIIYKASEIPNFAQGDMAMFSTYITFVLLQSFGYPFILALTITRVFAFLRMKANSNISPRRN
ncbi:MAG: hypothetical protein P8X57_13875, partial [Cyclobacteriaceae bacterium]